MKDNDRDTNAKTTTKENEGWTKPMKCVPIMHFDTKSNKSNEMNINSNRNDGLSEDVDVESEDHEETLVE